MFDVSLLLGLLDKPADRTTWSDRTPSMEAPKLATM